MRPIDPDMFTKSFIELNLRVLGYKAEEGTWAAHCLETDLVGYGKNFEVALEKLKELTDMQISFAIYKNQPALLDRPASPAIIETYNNLFRSYLQRFTVKGVVDKKHKIGSLAWPTHTRSADYCFVQA